jgi:membrane fusion protein, multidrug efflux system
MTRSFVLSLVLLPALALAGETSLKPADPPLRLVRAKKVQSTSRDEVTGQFNAAKTLPLGFELGGRLYKVRVKKGELVKAGTLLGQLDPEITDAQVAQAEAGVAAAEAGAELAADVSGRTQKLSTEGSVSDIQNKNAQVTAKQAASQVAMARAQLAQAKAARRRHDLSAPFTATVVDAPDQAGMLVGPGMPQFILMQLDTLVLKATISEAARAVVKPGLKVRVTSVATGASTDDAVVRVVLPSADPQSRRVPVEIDVPNQDGRFVAMTLGKASLPLGEARPAVVIPATALGTAGGDHVFAVAKDGTLKRLAVTVVERSGRDVTVVPPEPVEQLVDYPTSTLVEGTKVSSAR